jgi:hypothetical protein
MLVTVNWEHAAEPSALPHEVTVPDDVESDDVDGWLEVNHHSKVKDWAPLTRRADPSEPQAVACPHCSSQTAAQVGYVEYRRRGTLTVTTQGPQFASQCETTHSDVSHPIALECADCGASLQTLGRDPLEPPDPDERRAAISRKQQELAGELEAGITSEDLDFEAESGRFPNIEALDSVEAYDAGVEQGIELATGAAIRAACGSAAYVSQRDWRMKLVRFARGAISDDGAILIILRARTGPEVASRVYRTGDYASAWRMMDVACTRQTRVQRETEGNVYVARGYPSTPEHPGGIAIYTGRHCLLINVTDPPCDSGVPAEGGR